MDWYVPNIDLWPWPLTPTFDPDLLPQPLTFHTERGRSLLCAKVPVRIGRIGIFGVKVRLACTIPYLPPIQRIFPYKFYKNRCGVISARVMHGMAHTSPGGGWLTPEKYGQAYTVQENWSYIYIKSPKSESILYFFMKKGGLSYIVFTQNGRNVKADKFA